MTKLEREKRRNKYISKTPKAMTTQRKRTYWSGTRLKTRAVNPEWYRYVEQCYLEAMQQKLEAEQKISELRSHLLSIMDEVGVDSIRTLNTDVIIISESERTQIDLAGLRRDFPKIFAVYSSPLTVRRHLAIIPKKK